jgi:hypothetical protein
MIEPFVLFEGGQDPDNILSWTLDLQISLCKSENHLNKKDTPQDEKGYQISNHATHWNSLMQVCLEGLNGW